MANPALPAIPPVLDDINAPVVYVDELTGGGAIEGNLNLSFSALQYDHGKDTATPYRRIKLRLIIPMSAVPRMREFLGRIIDRATAPAPAGGPALQ